MQPRLSTSHQWTAFPTEFTEKIHQVFRENFKDEAARGEFLIEGRIYPQEILMRVGYIENGRLRQDNFEASIDYSQKSEEQSAFKMIYACIDALGSVIEQYFQMGEDEVEFPKNWEAFEFDEGVMWLQHSTVNTRLEEEADRWLQSQGEPALVKEEEAGEDALSRAIVDTDLANDVQQEIRKGTKLN